MSFAFAAWNTGGCRDREAEMVDDMSLKAMAGRYLKARDDWRDVEEEIK